MLSYRKTAAIPGLELTEVNEPPPPGPGEVLVRVEAVGICGSDLHVLKWKSGYDFMVPHLPLTLGHEFSGTVEAVGPGVFTSTLGDRVTVWPSSPCDVCPACRAGDLQNCLDKRTVGLMANGAFAPRVLARSNGVFQVPDSVTFDIAALTEPLCVGRRAVIVGNVSAGQRVLVLGPGTIGQAIALFAREAGCSDIAIAGFNDGPRLAVCRELGFANTFDLADMAQREEMERRFSDCHTVFEATGRSVSVGDGLSLLRKEGILVLTGIHSEPVTLELINIVRRKLQIRTSHGSRPADWAAVIETIGRLGPVLQPMITHCLPLSRIEEGFDLASSRVASKVIIHPQKNITPGDRTT